MKKQNVKQSKPDGTEKVAETKKVSKKNLTIIVVSAVLLVAVVSAVIIASVRYYKNNNPIDFLNDDLSYYINMKEEDYKNYNIEINIPAPDQTDIEHQKIYLLSKNRGELLDGGKYATDVAIKAGDKVYLRYLPYIYENGVRIDLVGDSNFDERETSYITVGQSGMIKEFDLGLIGEKPSDYGKFERFTMGEVREGDVAYVTVTYIEEEGGFYENVTERIDLRDENVENVWGEGILQYLQKKSIGLLNSTTNTLYRKHTGEAITYTQITVDFVTRSEENPLVIEGDFPYDYTEESLRNKHVYFDVYLDSVVEYSAPVFDDNFVRDTLKYTDEVLAGYSGATLTEKWSSMYLEELLDEHADACDAVAQEMMWDHLNTVADVKRLPQYEVRRIYDNYYYYYSAQYANNYADYYESLEVCICAMLGIDENADWKAYLTEMVEAEVKEKLIFYYIMREENLVPGDDEYESIYRRELEADFEYYYNKDKDDFESEAEYEKALKEYEEMLMEVYGEEKYRESVYFNYSSAKFLEMANVINVADK